MTYLEGVFVIKLLQEFSMTSVEYSLEPLCKLFINTRMFQAANHTYSRVAVRGGRGWGVAMSNL